MLLFVVDDDQRITTFITTVATRHGWTVETAACETEFQSLFQARRPDAVMLDLQLGASDGIEQLRFLHRHDYSGPVVLMSGFDTRVLSVARQVGHSLGITIVTTMEKPARAARVTTVLGQLSQQVNALIAAASPLMDPDPEFHPEAGGIRPASVAQAISTNQMELHLQPIITAADGTVRHAEGLIRWRHPIAGLVRPGWFVPIAEQDGRVIDQLTHWVIGTAIEQYRQLIELGFDMRICVNVSGRNLHSLNFPDLLAARLENADVPPEAIGLEITESVATGDMNATTDILTRLRLKGLSLSIDDFGTGYSSLEALHRIPFTSIKIDRGFVTDLASSTDSLAIVRSVIGLAQTMGLTTVAEGVETGEAARLLVELGVGALQGYLYSRPLGFQQFHAWLRAWQSRGMPLSRRFATTGET